MPFDIITYSLLKKIKPTTTTTTARISTTLPAAENLSAGDFVNIFDDGGTIKVRKADASINKPAHGYVLDDVSAGSDATVYFNGFNNKLSGLIVGKYYFLSDTTPGKVTDTAPITYLKQKLGFAISSDTINVIIEPPVELGYIGIFGGGYSGSYENTIDYVTISTPGNATDFGDLTVARNGLAATSNGTDNRGIFGGGYDGSNYQNTIDYVTISTPGNATDFGDLTVARNVLAATSNV